METLCKLKQKEFLILKKKNLIGNVTFNSKRLNSFLRSGIKQVFYYINTISY